MTQGFDELKRYAIADILSVSGKDKATRVIENHMNNLIEIALIKGAQSKQADIDELQKRVDVYEKHITVIKNIHENEFNKDGDTSWILGNLDGFFECLNEDLKGKQDD